MNPVQASMMPPQVQAPSMGFPGAPVQQVAPQMDLGMPPFNQAPVQDNFAMQQPAMPAAAPASQPAAPAQQAPSDAELAALMNILGAPQNQPGAPANPFSAPASSLQSVPGPNGEMILESNPISTTGNTGGGLLKSPLALLAGAAVVAGGIFLGLRMRNKGVTENAFEKLSQEASGLKDKIAEKLGRQDELDALHAATSKQVQDSISQYQGAINGVAAKQESAEQLTQKTDALFEHAKGLPEGGTLAEKIFKGFTDAVEDFKKKVADNA